MEYNSWCLINYYDVIMASGRNRDNSVNDTGTRNGDSVTLGMDVRVQQPEIYCQHDTATKVKTKWAKELNKLAMKCYLMSEFSKRGFRKKMHNIWTDIGVFELSEHKLAGQVLVIRNYGWLSEKEIEEIRREI